MAVLPDGINIVGADATTGIIGKGVKVPVAQVIGAVKAPATPTSAGPLVMNPDGSVVVGSAAASTGGAKFIRSRIAGA